MIWKTFADKGLNLLYPPGLYCNCCGNLIDDTRTYHLCDHCITHMSFDGEGIREINGLKVFRCTEYGLYTRTLIFALKYNGKRYIARDLALIMADRIELAQIEFDLIVPIPMFRKKERKRGFNHAALMGKFLAHLTGKPCVADGLLRTADTLPMRGLSPAERAVNVKGRFAVNPSCRKVMERKRILLIDDFYTTGSTGGECRKALLSIQPEEVYLLAFAAR
ncbi:MAG: hypothetical protein U0M21_05315 [Emergencia sp.]|nr:hypothetical protein [Emergencia sp.]